MQNWQIKAMGQWRWWATRATGYWRIAIGSCWGSPSSRSAGRHQRRKAGATCSIRFIRSMGNAFTQRAGTKGILPSRFCGPLQAAHPATHCGQDSKARGGASAGVLDGLVAQPEAAGNVTPGSRLGRSCSDRACGEREQPGDLQRRTPDGQTDHRT